MPITEQSNMDVRMRKSLRKKISDLDIITYFVTFKIFSEKLSDVILNWLSFTRSMLAMSVTCFWRFNYGKRSTGFIHIFFIILYLINYNSALVWTVFQPITTFFVSPILWIWTDWNEVYEMIFTQIRSEAFLGYTLLTSAILFVQLVWAQIVGNDEGSKTGNSWMFFLFSQFVESLDYDEDVPAENSFVRLLHKGLNRINEFHVTLLEIAVTLMISYGLWTVADEPRLAAHIAVGTAAWFFMEVIDQKEFADQRTMMNL